MEITPTFSVEKDPFALQSDTEDTRIKAILGFVKPDLGIVRIGGSDAQNAKGQVAYVPQRGGR